MTNKEWSRQKLEEECKKLNVDTTGQDRLDMYLNCVVHKKVSADEPATDVTRVPIKKMTVAQLRLECTKKGYHHEHIKGRAKLEQFCIENRYTVSELKDICRKREIKGYSNKSKEELVELCLKIEVEEAEENGFFYQDQKEEEEWYKAHPNMGKEEKEEKEKEKDVEDMTMSELREECQKKGIPTQQFKTLEALKKACYHGRFTILQLKEICRKKKISGYSKKGITKAELIELCIPALTEEETEKKETEEKEETLSPGEEYIGEKDEIEFFKKLDEKVPVEPQVSSSSSSLVPLRPIKRPSPMRIELLPDSTPTKKEIFRICQAFNQFANNYYRYFQLNDNEGLDDPVGRSMLFPLTNNNERKVRMIAFFDPVLDDKYNSLHMSFLLSKYMLEQ